MNEKFATITLEIPMLDIDDVAGLFKEVEAFVVGLREKGYKSDFLHFHINAEMDHLVGEDEEPELPSKRKKRKQKDSMKVVSINKRQE